MAFFKKKEKKHTNNSSTSSIPDLWEAGKIDAISVFLGTSIGFVAASSAFFDDIRFIKKDIMNHNNSNEQYRVTIDRIISGEEYPEKNLDVMLLSCHKKDIERISFNLNNRNQLTIVKGFIQLECLRQCNFLRPDETLNISKENLLSYCAMPEVQEAALEGMKKLGLKGTYEEIPAEEQLSFFYDVCAQYLKLFHEEHEPGGGKIADMFTKNGLICLPDENGQYQLAEEDFLATYEVIDYRGLV